MNTQNNTKQQPQSNAIHNSITVVASLLVFAGIGIAIWFFVFYHSHEETNDAQIEQYVTPVISRIGGYIQDVRFEENQFVHKGDTLLVIDQREFRSRLSMTQADLLNARQNQGILQKGVSVTNSNIAIHQAQLAAAKAQMWKTEQDFHRYENLVKEDAATVQQFEQVKAAYEQAQAHYTEIQSTIQSTELGTTEAESRVPAAAAIIEGKQAAVDNATLYLSYTVLTAPYDGWVGRKTVQPGQLIREGQTVVSVVSREKWITANFKETQLKHLSVGQPVRIKADAMKNTDFSGVVESLSPASGARFSLLPPDNSTGNFVKIEQRIPVRIRLTDNDSTTAFLRAGMNVVVIAKN